MYLELKIHWMRILYGIQGTGNGHISRARDIIPVLQQYGELDILVSGTQSEVKLNYPISYQFYGVSFIFGKRGGIDILKTLKKIRIFRFIREIWKLDVHQYDLIINDFEPVSAWACVLKAKKSVGLSHQAAVIHPFSPKPAKADFLGYLILRYYAPISTSYSLHFKPYANRMFSPVIRQEVRDLKICESNFYTVYLPAYSDERIIKCLSNFNVRFRVFSKHSKVIVKHENIEIIPIDNQLYLASLAKSVGLICGAGFEGPAEALFLRKKMLVIPMKGQYEQHCNAAALEKMGVKVLSSLKTKYLKDLGEFLNSDFRILVDYPDQTKDLIKNIIFENVKSDYVATNESVSFSR